MAYLLIRSSRDRCLFSPSPSLSAATASPPGSGSRVITAAGDPPRSTRPSPATLSPMPILVVSSLPPPVRRATGAGLHPPPAPRTLGVPSPLPLQMEFPSPVAAEEEEEHRTLLELALRPLRPPPPFPSPRPPARQPDAAPYRPPAAATKEENDSHTWNNLLQQ